MKARPEDTAAVATILKERAQWLARRRIDQWTGEFPPPSLAREIECGEVYLARIGDDTVGSVSLVRSQDEYWNGESGAALYLHRLAVRESYSGRDFGSKILELAELETKKRGFTTLRLDCLAENSTMRRYYEERGFEPKGTGRAGGREYALFEKKLN